MSVVSRRILIVEDEGLIALDLERRLERAGYSVVALAESMDEALEAAASLRPDLVFMDIRITGDQDGIETAARLRQDCDVPVIFVTAHGDAETLQRAKGVDPDGYILKPFVNVDFRAVIEGVFAKKDSQPSPGINETRISTS